LPFDRAIEGDGYFGGLSLASEEHVRVRTAWLSGSARTIRHRTANLSCSLEGWERPVAEFLRPNPQ
jgi:hypothetical protein